MAKVSNCCGDSGNKIFHNRKRHGDSDDITTYRDVELCGKCGEHCEFVEEWERDADISLALYGKNEVTIKSETNEDLSKAAEDLFTRFRFLDPKESKETLDKITKKIKS